MLVTLGCTTMINTTTIKRYNQLICSLLCAVLLLIMGCKKNTVDDFGNDTNKPVITELNTAFVGYSVLIDVYVDNANELNIQINDEFGHSVSSTFNALNNEGERVEITFNAKDEALIEGSLTVVILAKNEAESITESRKVDFLPFDKAQYKALFYDQNGQVLVADNQEEGLIVSNITENFPNEPLYVSASYNPLFLFYDNAQFFARRLQDSVLRSLNISVAVQGDFLPSIAANNRVFIPTSTGQIISFSRDLSSAQLINQTFTRTLINIVALKNAFALFYKGIDGNTFFELRSADATLRIREPEQINYESVFADAKGNLVFVQKGEGGIFNYREFNPAANSYDIVANSSPFLVSEFYNNMENGLIFKGLQQNNSGVFMMQSPNYTPQILIDSDTNSVRLKANYNLFSGGLIIQDLGAFYRINSTSTIYNVQLPFVISKSLFDVNKSFFIFPQ